MKTALIQQSAGLNKEENVQKGLDNAREAAAKGANIICFSELAFEPFYPQTPSNGNNLSLAEEIPGKTVNKFIELAKELGIVVILNLYENSNGKTFDSSPVIDADGALLGITRMVHITDYEFFHEQGYYFPGDKEIQVYKTKYGNIGVAICYDRHYPEYMRALALKGAEIVFTPQAGAVGEWPEGLYEAELRVASFQNGYFTALCNRVGKEEKLNFSGESFVCNPEGRVIAQAVLGEEDLLLTEIDLEQVKSSHARRLFLRDRRPELYPGWLD